MYDYSEQSDTSSTASTAYRVCVLIIIIIINTVGQCQSKARVHVDGDFKGHPNMHSIDNQSNYYFDYQLNAY